MINFSRFQSSIQRQKKNNQINQQIPFKYIYKTIINMENKELFKIETKIKLYLVYSDFGKKKVAGEKEAKVTVRKREVKYLGDGLSTTDRRLYEHNVVFLKRKKESKSANLIHCSWGGGRCFFI